MSARLSAALAAQLPALPCDAEGPVFAESWRYLEARGIAIELGVLADEARAVFALYKGRGGLVYNA